MVLFHQDGKVWDHNERRKSQCHYCGVRLSILVDGVVKLMGHIEDSIFGPVCDDCFRKKVEGDKLEWRK